MRTTGTSIVVEGRVVSMTTFVICAWLRSSEDSLTVENLSKLPENLRAV